MSKLDYSKLSPQKRRASLIEPANYGYKIWTRKIVDQITGVAEIRMDYASERSQKIMPIIDEEKGSQVLGTSKEQDAESNEGDGNQIDEEIAYIDDDIWETLVNPWTLFFRSRKNEDAYFRTGLLPNRVLLMRLTTFIIIIVLLIYMSVFNDVPCGSIIWVISLVLCVLLFLLASWDQGKYYISLCVESKYHRLGLIFIEVTLFLGSSLDVFYDLSIAI